MLRVTPLILALLSCTWSQAAPNAAETYQEVFQQLDALPWEQLNALQEMPAYLEPCDPGLQQALDPLVGRLKRAARAQTSDFGLDLSEGMDLLLPHLSSMRNASRVLLAQARRHARSGEMAEAVVLLDTVNRMALHMKQDRTLISSLVGTSMFRSAGEEIDALAADGLIRPEQARMLLRPLQEADARDPMGITDAIEAERIHMGGWIRTLLQKAIEAEQRGDSENSQVDLRDLGLDLHVKGMALSDYLEKDMVEYDRYMGEVVEIMGLENEVMAKKRIAELEQHLEDGDHGHLATIIAPSMDRLVQEKFELQLELDWQKAGLTRLAEGLPLEDETPNAAWAYIAVARSIDALSAEQRADSELTSALMDELMLTTLIERCEFPIGQGTPRPVVPSWSTGLLAGSRLLMEDARNRFESADIDGAVSRIVTVLGLAADLSATVHLLDSVIAHEMTNDAMTLVGELDELELLDADTRRALLVALREIPSGDPYGYRRSGADSRRLLAAYLEGIERPLTVSMPTDGDGTLYLLVFHELHQNPEYPTIHCWPLVIDLDALEGLVDATMIQETRQHGLDMLEAAKLDVVIPMEPVPGIVTNPISTREAAGAEQLKQWKRRLGN